MRKVPFFLGFYLTWTGLMGLLFSNSVIVTIFSPGIIGSAMAMLLGTAGLALAGLPELRQQRVKKWSIRTGLILLLLIGILSFLSPKIAGVSDDVYVGTHTLFVLFTGMVMMLLLGIEPETERVPMKQLQRRLNVTKQQLAHLRKTASHS